MKHFKRAVAMTIALIFCGQANAELSQEKYQSLALELLRETISFRTVEGSGEVRPQAQLLRDWFLANGFSKDEVHYIETQEDKAGVVVRYKGSGKGGEPILLMAHMDVVDALRSDWNSDPFELLEKDGYLYGRGTLDDKSGGVLLGTTLVRLKSEGYLPSRDLVLILSGDEETYSYNIRSIIEEHWDLVKAEFALSADAGGGRQDENGKMFEFLVQAAEKTYMDFELTVRNPGGHSSRPTWDNAIMHLVSALQKIDEYRFPTQASEITSGYFAAAARYQTGDLAKAMQRFSQNHADEWAIDYLWSEPNYVGLTRTTCLATQVEAGHARNALPQTAWANVNCRVFPGESVEETLATLVRVVDNPDVEIKVHGSPRSTPASELTPNVMGPITEVVSERYGDVPIIPYMMPAATDAVETRIVGIPTYGLRGVAVGPDDYRAHGQDERISKTNFYEALEFWYVLLKAFTR